VVIGLLILGAMNQFASGILDPGWGLLLIVVGLGSLYFRSLAMLAIYGITISWALVSNLGSGRVGWFAFAALQAWVAYSVFRKFVVLRRAQLRLASASPTTAAVPAGVASLQLAAPGAWSPDASTSDESDRAARVFPQAGCALTALSVVGVVALFVAIVVHNQETGTAMDSVSTAGALKAVVNLGVLGLALGVASLLMRYQARTINILTVAVASMWLLLYLALAYLT